MKDISEDHTVNMFSLTAKPGMVVTICTSINNYSLYSGKTLIGWEKKQKQKTTSLVFLFSFSIYSFSTPSPPKKNQQEKKEIEDRFVEGICLLQHWHLLISPAK